MSVEKNFLNFEEKIYIFEKKFDFCFLILRKKCRTFLAYIIPLSPGTHWFPKKYVCPLGPAVWPAIANLTNIFVEIHIHERSELLYRMKTNIRELFNKKKNIDILQYSICLPFFVNISYNKQFAFYINIFHILLFV